MNSNYSCFYIIYTGLSLTSSQDACSVLVSLVPASDYFYLSNFVHVFIHSEMFTENWLCTGHCSSGEIMANKVVGLLPSWSLESAVENQCETNKYYI